MTLNKIRIGLLLAVLIAIIADSCKKDDAILNPFSDPSNLPPPSTIDDGGLSPSSLAGLHKNIFKPKCANSGCHDGNFEPDYRTIESSYNTLVYHRTSQKGDSLGFTYRIVPFDTTNSFLHERITKDVNNLPGAINYGEGIMPLYSSLTTKEIGYIEQWIMEGAKDIFDSNYVVPNSEPQMLGVVAYKSGDANTLSRASNNGPIQVPSNFTSVDIWISITDDKTSTEDLMYNKIKFSLSLNNYDSSDVYDLTIDVNNPKTEPGYYGNPPGYFPDDVVFYHKITINPNDFGVVGDFVWFRVYIQDEEHSYPTEIPEKAASYLFKKYFAFEII